VPRGLRQSLPVATDDGRAPWLVVHASQSGLGEQLAWRAAAQLQAAGHAVQVLPLARVDAAQLARTAQALLVLSTFGDGEPPDAARGAARRLLAQAPDLSGLQFGLLALGDRQYPHYCGFGRQFDGWLLGNGARPLFERIDVDAASVPALRQWQQQLGALTGIATDDSVLPAATQMHEWRLLGRDRLNPGSVGGAIWRIRLAPRPTCSGRRVTSCISRPARRAARQCGAEGTWVGSAAAAAGDGHRARCWRWPASASCPMPMPRWRCRMPACGWRLPLLPGREYSIASCTDDGTVELVVRLVHDASGRTGLGSGWLSLHAPIGASIVARVHRNPGFHRVGGAPMVLIGNGTGIAGLRSLLREAAHAGERGHWLLFGERQRARLPVRRRDRSLAGQWPSRAGGPGVLARWRSGYVQDRLRAAVDALRDWMQRGAVIHVCGSLQGMAEGVDQVLRAALGDEAVETLLENGRYRRDVY
jgi:sulfite reductase (NADPH) flavoprotein alpha-component